MTLELDWLIVVPVLLGHIGVFVVILNVAHAIGMPDRRGDFVFVGLFGTAVALAGLIVVRAVAGPWSSWPWMLQGYSIVCLATALVGLPVSNVFRKIRKLPDGISASPSVEVDLAATEGKEALIGSGKHSWMLHLHLNESFRIKKTEWQVVFPNLPEEWDGLSLVHLTDFHFAPCFRRRFFEAVADEAGAWDADLVAFTGDLVDHDHAIDWIEPVMTRLRGRLGTFAILGNHDYEHHPRAVRQALVAAGFTDLEGRWTELEIDGSTLAVGGTSYPWGPAIDPLAMPEADFRILLSHSPDRFARAARRQTDLVLAGHNHAGQIRLPLVGPVFMPSLYSRHFDRGFFRSGRTLMYVSQGVAGKHPIRLGGCGPELTRLVLRASKPRIPSASAVRRSRTEGALDSRG